MPSYGEAQSINTVRSQSSGSSGLLDLVGEELQSAGSICASLEAILTKLRPATPEPVGAQAPGSLSNDLTTTLRRMNEAHTYALKLLHEIEEKLGPR